MLIYSFVLIPAAQHRDSALHMYAFFSIFFSTVIYLKTVNIIPCAIQQDFLAYHFYAVLSSLRTASELKIRGQYFIREYSQTDQRVWKAGFSKGRNWI